MDTDGHEFGSCRGAVARRGVFLCGLAGLREGGLLVEEIAAVAALSRNDRGAHGRCGTRQRPAPVLVSFGHTFSFPKEKVLPDGMMGKVVNG